MFCDWCTKRNIDDRAKWKWCYFNYKISNQHMYKILWNNIYIFFLQASQKVILTCKCLTFYSMTVSMWHLWWNTRTSSHIYYYYMAFIFQCGGFKFKVKEKFSKINFGIIFSSTLGFMNHNAFVLMVLRETVKEKPRFLSFFLYCFLKEKKDHSISASGHYTS